MEISSFTGLHGTGHGFHVICPNFTGLVYTGSAFKKNAPDGIGIANVSTGSVLTAKSFSKLYGITGLSRIPWNPAGFSQRENPEESSGSNAVCYLVFRSTFAHISHLFRLRRPPGGPPGAHPGRAPGACPRGPPGAPAAGFRRATRAAGVLNRRRTTSECHGCNYLTGLLDR